MKKLTKEGRFECGIDQLVMGRIWAFTPVITAHEPEYIGLGVAVANEPGYYQIPLTWCYAFTWDEMQAHADELNREAGLTIDMAERIVVSSMRNSGASSAPTVGEQLGEDHG